MSPGVASSIRRANLVAITYSSRWPLIASADQLLVGHRPVQLRGVQEVDPQLQRALDGGDRLALVGRAVEGRHPHAAQAERRDFQRCRACACSFLLQSFASLSTIVRPGRAHATMATMASQVARARWPVATRSSSQVGERTVRDLEPRPRLLLRPRGDQARPGPLLPERRRRDRAGAARAAVHAAPLPEGGRRREGPPEADTRRGAGLAGDRPRSTFPASAAQPTSCASPSWPA